MPFVNNSVKHSSDIMNKFGISVYIASDKVNNNDSNMDEKTFLAQFSLMISILDLHEAYS